MTATRSHSTGNLNRQIRQPRRMANGHQSPRRQPSVQGPNISIEIYIQQ